MNETVKIYGMPTCPYCSHLFPQIEGNARFEFIDIGAHVRNMHVFIDLRDTNPAFDRIKAKGTIGIPCFVLADGTVTLDARDVGLENYRKPNACSIADHKNGTSGC